VTLNATIAELERRIDRLESEQPAASQSAVAATAAGGRPVTGR
jgi:outer membrane murein-binding lipoprotein Lpp